MIEYIKNNKSKILRVIVLLLVFFLATSYINGRNLYKKNLDKGNSNINKIEVKVN